MGRASIGRRAASPNKAVAALPSSLYAAGQSEGRFALRQFRIRDTQDQRRTAIAAGSTVEYMLRCVLAVEDPVLLAERNSVVALSRANRSRPLSLADTRSIVFSDALTRLKLVNPTLKIRARAEQIVTVRNAAVHMAMAHPPSTLLAVRNMVTVVDELLDILESDRGFFWGVGLTEVLNGVRNEAATELALTVASKIANARATFNAMVGELGFEARASVMRGLAARHLTATGDDVTVRPGECVVCASTGDVLWMVERDLEGDAHGDWASYVAYSEISFTCPVCGFELDAAELQEAGVRYEALDDEMLPADDPYADWEPDEDEYRGR